jgi:LacI family transcriptional regulator
MARTGAEMMINQIHSPRRAPRQVNFPCDLIVRGSTELASLTGNGEARHIHG